MQYIKQAIVAADSHIKEDGKQNREHEGMGSTIVLAWIVGKEVYIGWCGDSRAYRYNPAFGLERLSNDHSYVQELVDSGKLMKELAFDHPDSNIITRSLGDSRQQAQPDVINYRLNNGDMILLCSDGLSGVLRDVEIEQIMANNADTVENCRNALWAESEQAGWTDNVTIALCKIVSGAEQLEQPETPVSEPAPIDTAIVEVKKRKGKGFRIVVIVLLLLGIAFGIGYYLNNKNQWFEKIKTNYISYVTSTGHVI
jgi:protein phosphatase